MAPIPHIARPFQGRAVRGGSRQAGSGGGVRLEQRKEEEVARGRPAVLGLKSQGTAPSPLAPRFNGTAPRAVASC